MNIDIWQIHVSEAKWEYLRNQGLNVDHLKIIHEGAKVWNQWRRDNPNIQPELSHCGLGGVSLGEINLDEAGCSKGIIEWQSREKINLTDAILNWASFARSNMRGAILLQAELGYTDFSETNLSQADLSYSLLTKTIFNNSNLDNADFTNALVTSAQFINVDLSTVKGLETVQHSGPSTIDIDTLVRSKGQIPRAFLIGCGVPNDFITYMRSLIIDPFEYNSCFISYSHTDEDFAQRLHSALQDKNLRVWYALEDMKRGQKIHEQIEEAIQVHDRLLLVLSAESMNSEWVKTEIYKARQREIKEKRRILFPIALVPFAKIKEWEFFDGDTGKDLAREIREYYIPDFTNWKEPISFENEFNKLLRDLKGTKDSPRAPLPKMKE